MTATTTEVSEQINPTPKAKVYKKRWIILALFSLFSAANEIQWIQYSIISSIITKYYGVSNIWVNWTSMIYMVLYIPFIFPASYLLDRFGLRLAVILGILGTCLGSWIKVASVTPDRFYVGFIGQSVAALSQIFALSVPARLAAVWFGPDQVSTACSIGVFGNQLGIAIGFLIPPIICSGGSDEDVTRQLYILFIGNSVFCTILLVLILLFFQSAPPTPPSQAVPQQKEDNQYFIISLKNLLKNRNFVLLFIAYGINVGVFYAMSTLLSDIVTKHYPGKDEDAGRIGLVIVVAGMVGSVACGYALDKFRKFKETTLVVYAFSLLGMLLFTFTLSKGLYVVYITSGILGFFMTGLFPVGFELGSELTYPEPEGTQAGLLNCSSQIFGIIFTNIYSQLFYKVDDIWANLVMSIFLGIGLLMTSMIRRDLRRQAALNAENK